MEYSSGSLGIAISVGIGLAISAKEHNRTSKIYVLMGDGELNEGSIWEGLQAAAHYKLDNLMVIVDRNHLSYDGDTEEVMGLENLDEKFKAFNWNVSNCDGHDIEQLLRAFQDISLNSGQPYAIIAHTIKGKGISFAENRPEWHHHAITKEQYEQAKLEILGA